jgi:IS30 family transposase
MLWLTERVTRFSIPVTMPEGYAGDAMLAGLICGLDQIPPHLLRSITFDQGTEWGCWETIASTYGIDVWFCDPHSPWQRGQVENLNRQWRFWFPRGTDLSGVEPAHADHVASIVNGQRRRSLGYQSPTALYAAATVQ